MVQTDFDVLVARCLLDKAHLIHILKSADDEYKEIVRDNFKIKVKNKNLRLKVKELKENLEEAKTTIKILSMPELDPENSEPKD